MKSLWPGSSCSTAPPAASQIHAVSVPAVMARVPSWLIAALDSRLVRPLSSPTTLPPARSHTCALPNSIAVRIRIPSALNVTLTSRRVGNVLPPGATLSSRNGLPLATFHTRTVPSDDAVRTRPPSGLNATRLTGPSCLSSCSSSPLPAFHTRAVPSAEPLTTCVPSALNATLLTALVCPERTRCRRLTCAAPASFVSKPVTSWVDQPRASGERPGGGRPCTAIRLALLPQHVRRPRADKQRHTAERPGAALLEPPRAFDLGPLLLDLAGL